MSTENAPRHEVMLEAMSTCRALMYSDPVTLKQGYTAPNAVMATARWMETTHRVTMTDEECSWLLSIAEDPRTGWAA
jgi:hypothetical protein